ncbi:MAG TPA: hypothetical protein PLL53_14060, partial [Saprospiraceae bacterium]|nr:hypothetical protein [Saprospiraceae bacterium]
MNRLHEVMENGAGLSPGLFTNDWLPFGQPVSQAALALPLPDSDSLYYLFHVRREYLSQMNMYGQSAACFPFYYSLIDVSENDGLGSVLEKNIVLTEDTIGIGQITACRHANGRDWWIIVFKYFSNQYHSLLLHPTGVMQYPLKIVGIPRPSGSGRAVFSPDGTKYVKFNLQMGPHLDVYDFDRCTGNLSNPRYLNYNHLTDLTGGVAISPNSRYLYVSSGRYIFQYDLHSENIGSSETLIADYVDTPGMKRFSGSQLAPDNKVYISGTSSSSYIHVIHNPNAAGAACEFEQGGLFLGAESRNWAGIPNHPYYGLGPWDGSPCDTLGI